MTIARAAEQVLADHGEPMHVKVLLDEIVNKNLATMAAVDKQHVLYWTLLSRSLGGPTKRAASSRPFFKSDRATFGLVRWLSPEQRKTLEAEEAARRASGSVPPEEENPVWWRDELFAYLERGASDADKKPYFGLHWKGRPELHVDMVIVNAEPRARVTDDLLGKLDGITPLMLEQFRQIERDRFQIATRKIRAARGKTITLNQARNVLIPYLKSERQTLSVNAFEALHIELETVKDLWLPAEQQRRIAGLGRSCSFQTLAEAFGILDAEDDEPADGLTETADPEQSDELNQYERHHNLIFFGPPGTGKSYTVAEIVRLHLGADERENVFRVTFHPEYTYFDFVGTYRPATKWLTQDGVLADVPTRDGRTEPRIYYTFAPGPFSLALAAAATQVDRNVVLLIEEINRGNCAAIFGDVFQLLDRVKDERRPEFGMSEYAITPTSEWANWLDEQGLEASAWSNKKLRLPGNLYIYATMNTSDQSLFPIDTAFRRRWGMQYQGITSKTRPPTRVPLHGRDAEGVLWTALMEPLNRLIVEHRRSDDKQMGAYFVRPTTGDFVDPLEFSSKVLFYLWADVFRDEPHRVFNDKAHTFDTLHHQYESGRDIFRAEILAELRPDAGAMPEQMAPTHKTT